MLRLLHRIHRIAGIALLIPAFLVALSGALLAALEPSQPPRVGNMTRISPNDTVAAIDRAFTDARERHGDDSHYLIRPPRHDDEAIAVLVDGPRWHGRRHYHPVSGEPLGSIDFSSEFGYLLSELHDSLLLGDTGKLILLVSAAGAIVLSISGFCLWLRTSYRRRDLSSRQLHRHLGACFAVAILLAFASGAYMVWRPLSAAVNHLAGAQAIAAPKASLPAGGKLARLDTLVGNAEAVLPGGRIGYIAIAPNGREAVRIRKRFADDPHPNGLSSIWLEPSTGMPIRHVRWNELDPGSRLFAWIYPLHSGHLGGLSQRLLWICTGLCTAFLAYSGLRLWLRRKTGAKRSAFAPAPTESPTPS